MRSARNKKAATKGKRQRIYCKRPDWQEPRMVCGYPLPCPYHTFIVDSGSVTVPAKGDVRVVPILRQIGKVVDPE